MTPAEMKQAYTERIARLDGDIRRATMDYEYRATMDDYRGLAAYLEVLMVEYEHLVGLYIDLFGNDRHFKTRQEFRNDAYARSYQQHPSRDPSESRYRNIYEEFMRTERERTAERDRNAARNAPRRPVDDWIRDFVRDFNTSNGEEPFNPFGNVRDDPFGPRYTGSDTGMPPKTVIHTKVQLQMKIAKIERLARDPAATEGEKANARAMAEKLRQQL